MNNIVDLSNSVKKRAASQTVEDEPTGATTESTLDKFAYKIGQHILKEGFPPGGGGGNLEARVASLESSVIHIQTDISEIKTDIRDIRSDVSKITPEMIKWFFVTALAIIGILISFISWIKI